MAKRPTRLRFTEDDLADSHVKKAADRADKAVDRAEKEMCIRDRCCKALIGVPIFFLVKATGNVSLAALSMMIVMLPLFFLAMYEKDRQPLEVVVEHFIQTKFVRPKVRPYQTLSLIHI